LEYREPFGCSAQSWSFTLGTRDGFGGFNRGQMVLQQAGFLSLAGTSFMRKGSPVN
jgi:hypothetical protein